MKSAFVSIVGRPSSGKSSLINFICKTKISIVSPHPQTTRNKIRGIYTEERGQIIFLDTPGFHRSEKKFNLKLLDIVYDVLKDSDHILYMVDKSRKFGDEESDLINLLKEYKDKVIIVFSKIDLSALMNEELIKQEFDVPVFEISTKTKIGVKELLNYLFQKSPEGELYYPEDITRDYDLFFQIKEIIREKAIKLLKEELPHSLNVEIEEIEKRDGTNFIRASVIVEKNSQKGMVIGANGSLIKKIRVAAQSEIKNFIFSNYLDLRVKVDPKWKSSDNNLKKVIY